MYHIRRSRLEGYVLVNLPGFCCDKARIRPLLEVVLLYRFKSSDYGMSVDVEPRQVKTNALEQEEETKDAAHSYVPKGVGRNRSKKYAATNLKDVDDDRACGVSDSCEKSLRHLLRMLFEGLVDTAERAFDVGGGGDDSLLPCLISFCLGSYMDLTSAFG